MLQKLALKNLPLQSAKFKPGLIVSQDTLTSINEDTILSHIMFILFILSTASCLIEPAASIMIKFLLKWCSKETEEDQEMRKELIALKREITNISMIDQFAKYAKMQRKYNKLQEEVKQKISTRSSLTTKLKMSMTFGIHIFSIIFSSVIMFLYRSEAVIAFPSGYLWPLNSLLSWPLGTDSHISLPTWIILMRLSVSSLLKTSTS